MRKPHAGRTLTIGLAIGAVVVSIVAALAATPVRTLITSHGSTPGASRGSTLVASGHRANPVSRKSTSAGSGGSTPDASQSPTRTASPVHPAAQTTRRRVLFGATTNLLPKQPAIGHLGIVRTYYRLGEQFGGRTSDSIMHQGSTMIISLDLPRRGVGYASIVAGRHNRAIRRFLTQVERSAVHYHIPAVYVSFEHEANSPSHSRLGTPAQFVAAWRHIHKLAARARLNWNTGGRLHWVLILDRMTYFTRAERPRWSFPMGFAANYYAGRSYVDALAADGYNAGSCGKPEPSGFLQPGDSMVTPRAMFNPLLTFAKKHGHSPVIISEWASVRYRNPAVRPRFIHLMQEYTVDHPAIKAVSYWDSWGPGARGYGGPHSAACNFTVNKDPRSLAALAVMNRALHGG